MAVVVLGLDALDPELVDTSNHPNLTLNSHKKIDTIESSNGIPSTHELWPTIITGLPPEKHGIQLEGGVAWENSLLDLGSRIGKLVLPNNIRAALGAWLLNNTEQEPFRIGADYYRKKGIETVFDNHASTAIGIPNYVTKTNGEDRENFLRRNVGALFERDPESRVGHKSANPEEFYEQCMEMVMTRIIRIRRALRSEKFELVFGYTSGLDLVGHISFDRKGMQETAYREVNDFVGDLVSDLGDQDIFILVSDHGLQNGVHTHNAIVASTHPEIIDPIDSVLTVRNGIERALELYDHTLREHRFEQDHTSRDSGDVKQHLQDLGYI